jgi:hypothetical protein
MWAACCCCGVSAAPAHVDEEGGDGCHHGGHAHCYAYAGVERFRLARCGSCSREVAGAPSLAHELTVTRRATCLHETGAHSRSAHPGGLLPGGDDGAGDGLSWDGDGLPNLAAASEPESTTTGAALSVVLPSPSCPYSFCPAKGCTGGDEPRPGRTVALTPPRTSVFFF